MFGKQLFQLIQKDSFLSKTTCTEKFERPCFLGFQDSSELGFSRFGVWGVKKPGVESRRRGVTPSIGLCGTTRRCFPIIGQRPHSLLHSAFSGVEELSLPLRSTCILSSTPAFGLCCLVTTFGFLWNYFRLLRRNSRTS